MSWNSDLRRFADRDEEIFKRREAGENCRELGESYGIGKQRVSDIHKREKRRRRKELPQETHQQERAETMSSFITVYNIIIHLPPSHSNDKSPKVRVADSFGSEQMAKDALFDLVVSDFEAAQKEGTDLINKRSFSLQKMLVHTPQDISKELLKEQEYSFNPALFQKVQELELSIRAENGLKEGKIFLIGDLIQASEAELLRLPNFGRKSLNEIKELLATMGLHLGMKVKGWERQPSPYRRDYD